MTQAVRQTTIEHLYQALDALYANKEDEAAQMMELVKQEDPATANKIFGRLWEVMKRPEGDPHYGEHVYLRTR